jgi:hypothetical protein
VYAVVLMRVSTRTAECSAKTSATRRLPQGVCHKASAKASAKALKRVARLRARHTSVLGVVSYELTQGEEANSSAC